MKWVYQCFGISKQAYHQRLKNNSIKEKQHKIVLELIRNVRRKMPKTGVKKLYKHIKNELIKNDIKMGRDALFDLLRSYGLLVKKTKRFHITTDSNHFFYKSPNLIKELEITHAEQVLVCDITYIKIDGGHAYLALVTDAYSKKLMGWILDDNMRVDLVKEALEMAYKNLIYNHKHIIHHSDRGIQYCCPDYSEFAEKRNFILSTTQQYDPYENAVAERINGILKYEFGLINTIKNIEIAQKMVKQAVEIYNNERLHWSLDLKTPQEVHLNYDKQTYKSYKRKTA
ncbi:MAG: IS3 family transposase [Flavobacteriaceae bacterium]|nr:IS3 family transposase [Flavobacteriaceae bacterium]